jgi:hypothetical protein
MMRDAKRTHRDQRRAGADAAGDAVDARGFERFRGVIAGGMVVSRRANILVTG